MEAKAGQTFLDAVVQTTGDLEAAFALAMANGVSVTDDLVPGQTIAILTNKPVKYFENNYLPATEISAYQAFDADYGIGEMEIGNDFIAR